MHLDWEEAQQHLLTKKHKNNQILQDTTEKSQKVAKKHICECGREYLHHSSLYKHKKTCKMNQLIIPDDNMDYKKMFLELVKQNKFSEAWPYIQTFLLNERFIEVREELFPD